MNLERSKKRAKLHERPSTNREDLTMIKRLKLNNQEVVSDMLVSFDIEDLEVKVSKMHCSILNNRYGCCFI